MAAVAVKAPSVLDASGNVVRLTSPVSEGSFKLVHSNHVPAQQQKHLQFLDFNTSGDLILGCSSLNTRYMTGSLWYYKAGTKAEAVTNPEACLTGVDMSEAGIMDGRFVREDQVVVGLDSGGLVMVTLTKDEEGDKTSHYLECHTATVEHDDILTGLDTWASDNTVATCGMDNRLCVYNPALVMVQSYSPVHGGHVSGVSCNQSSEHVVATCSKNVDMSVRVWDTRQNKPASTVARMTEHPPSSVAWSDDRTLVVGSVTGRLTRLDTRGGAGQSVLDSASVGDRAVFRTRLAPGGKRMAVACDDAEVGVVSLEAGGMEVTRLKSGHRDFVRGLAWSSDSSLWSAGWDTRVEQHTV